MRSCRFAALRMIGLFLAPFGATEKDAEKPHDAHKKRTAPKSCPYLALLLALAELRSAACGFETVLLKAPELRTLDFTRFFEGFRIINPSFNP